AGDAPQGARPRLAPGRTADFDQPARAQLPGAGLLGGEAEAMMIDGSTIQADIDAACSPSTGGGGGIIHVPAGIYLLSEGLRFWDTDNPNLSAQVTLQGDGINSTVIYTNTPNIDLLTVARSHVSLRGIYFQGSQ